MKTQVEIKDYINSIEKKFPVNDWKVNEIEIWPIIRIKLFFYLFYKVHSNETLSIYKSEKSKSNKIFKIKFVIESIFCYFKFIKNLPFKKHLFISTKSTRVVKENLLYNKIIDSLIEEKNWHSDSIIFEVNYEKESKYYNSKNIFDFVKPLNGYVSSFTRLLTKVD